MEFSKRLVTTGRFKGHIDYEPLLLPLRNGERLNMVAQVTMRDDDTGGGHWCLGILTGQRFRLQTKLPMDVGCPKLTILNAAKSFYQWPVLVMDERSDLLIHPSANQSNMLSMVETCAGLGGLGCGAQYAGWTVVAQNDFNEKFAKHQSKISNVPVVCDDIGKIQTVAALHKASAGSGTIAFGFSCQPFSTAGDQKQGQDPRAQSLPSSLYASFLLQKEIIVCECVPSAATSKFVLECIEQYLEVTQSTRSETLLELADIWPSKRRRWWTIIIKAQYGKVMLQPLPKLKIEPTVSCLLPQFLTLNADELAALLLSPEERKGFATYGKGIGANLVDKSQPLSTALHSWGNQLIQCFCGCRGPFSQTRLQKDGLFGALVHVPDMPPDQNLRHLSAREVCLLTGFPKQTGWDDHPRLLLAGIGQLASPIQSAWIFAQLRNHLIEAKVIAGEVIQPSEIITCVTTDLFDLRDKWLPDQSSVLSQLFQEQFDDWMIAKQPTVPPPEPAAFDDLTSSQEVEVLERVKAAEKESSTHLGHADHSGTDPVASPTEILPGAHLTGKRGPQLPSSAHEVDNGGHVAPASIPPEPGQFASSVLTPPPDLHTAHGQFSLSTDEVPPVEAIPLNASAMQTSGGVGQDIPEGFRQGSGSVDISMTTPDLTQSNAFCSPQHPVHFTVRSS